MLPVSTAGAAHGFVCDLQQQICLLSASVFPQLNQRCRDTSTAQVVLLQHVEISVKKCYLNVQVRYINTRACSSPKQKSPSVVLGRGRGDV